MTFYLSASGQDQRCVVGVPCPRLIAFLVVLSFLCVSSRSCCLVCKVMIVVFVVSAVMLVGMTSVGNLLSTSMHEEV